jgi:hypothetical protein
MSNQLNRKQSTLSFYTSGRVLTNRPGPKVKASITLTAASSAVLIFGVRRRRKVGGVNEAEVIKAFKDSQAHHAIGEPDSGDNSEGYSLMVTTGPGKSLNVLVILEKRSYRLLPTLN